MPQAFTRSVPFADRLIHLQREADGWRYTILDRPTSGQNAFALPVSTHWHGPFPNDAVAVKDAQRRIVTQHF